jgi:hypothetical protein
MKYFLRIKKKHSGLKPLLRGYSLTTALKPWLFRAKALASKIFNNHGFKAVVIQS